MPAVSPYFFVRNRAALGGALFSKKSGKKPWKYRKIFENIRAKLHKKWYNNNQSAEVFSAAGTAAPQAAAVRRKGGLFAACISISGAM